MGGEWRLLAQFYKIVLYCCYGISEFYHPQASFVLCRVFVKSPSGNNASDHVISSCGEESVSAVRHVGIQHDGTATSDIVEANVHGDNSVDTKNEIPKISARLLSELDDQVMTHRGFVADFNFPLGIQAHNPVRLLQHFLLLYLDSNSILFIIMLQVLHSLMKLQYHNIYLCCTCHSPYSFYTKF